MLQSHQNLTGLTQFQLTWKLVLISISWANLRRFVSIKISQFFFFQNNLALFQSSSFWVAWYAGTSVFNPIAGKVFANCFWKSISAPSWVWCSADMRFSEYIFGQICPIKEKPERLWEIPFQFVQQKVAASERALKKFNVFFPHDYFHVAYVLPVGFDDESGWGGGGGW